jgi:meiotically up-regulated gene 157 (Mug157) protein
MVVAAALAASTPQYAQVVAVYHHAADVNASCFFQAADHTTYVNTGDIDAMWLRDSSVQAMSYLDDRQLVRGVIARQERMISIDPYANAFRRDYEVAERKFELDSLSYPVRLVDGYERATGDRSVFDAAMHRELLGVLSTFSTEQDHQMLSRYHHEEHPVDSNIGLIWSAYRPSDDPQAYNYNIPENMFAAVTLRTMSAILLSQYHDDAAAHRASSMADRIEAAISQYAVFETRHGRIYAYEIDGLGHAKFMDDANVPSLLSTPLLGFPYDPAVYDNTRKFALSPANPYFFHGKFAAGIGSSHTPQGFIWPMSLVVEYRTSAADSERNRVVSELSRTEAGDGVLHESFDVNDPKRFTRPKFGWVNALFEQTFRSGM